MATVATIAETTIVGDNEDQLVTMIVDNQLFGIPILQVQDIVEASSITPVPLAPSAIAGVLNLRGRIVTVIDLRKLLGNNEEVAWDSQMGVTVEHKGDLYTLLVDAIGDVRTLPRRDFDSAPSTMEDAVRQLCSGIYRLRGNLLVVLDVSRILHTDVIEATPMLSVRERRERKEAAQESAGGESRYSQQLSALMTDLNSYESDVEGVFGEGAESEADDMKARKKANRNRRPVGERWQEVLEDKARKSGQVTYRMREPDEETVELAREEREQEDADWAARVMDPETIPPESREDAQALQAPQADPAPEMPEAAFDPAPAETPPPADEAPATDTATDAADSPASASPESAGMISGWWNKLRDKAGGSQERKETSDDEPAPSEQSKADATPAKTDEASSEAGERKADAAPKEKKAKAAKPKSTKKTAKKSAPKSKKK